MGLLDFFASNASAPPPGQPQPISGLLAPQPAVSPAQQNWMNALGVISAGLRDAGAYLQHQPQAANNVAALARQRSGLQTPGASMLARLPPMITAALLLNAARPQAPQIAATAPQTSGTAPATGPMLVSDPNRASSPPEGIDPLIWEHMTPEERALWQK